MTEGKPAPANGNTVHRFRFKNREKNSGRRPGRAAAGCDGNKQDFRAFLTDEQYEIAALKKGDRP